MLPTRSHVGLLLATFGVAALDFGVAAHAAEAAAPASVWDLALAGGQKTCRLTLHPDTSHKGAPVAMPPGCHLAFPELKRITAWSEVGDGRLEFEDARGEPLLVFDTDTAGFHTRSPQGQDLVLKPASPASRDNLAKAAALAASPADAAAPAAKATPARKPTAVSTQKPAEVAGRYAVLRDKTHDTGCMVTLDDKTHGPGNTLKARLAPACRDQGIVIFDPVGWAMAKGALVLTARKGHTTELTTQDDGSWMNDPKKGKSLSLKRI